jgi:hypothetical protein
MLHWYLMMIRFSVLGLSLYCSLFSSNLKKDVKRKMVKLSNVETEKLKEKLSELMKNQSVNDWLSEFKVENTKQKYLRRMANFLEKMNTTPDAIKAMDSTQLKKLVIDYQNLVKGTLKNNGILGNITAIRSFAGFLGTPLKFRRSQLVSIETDTASHRFTNADLKLLFDVSNTFEKALLATAVSEGWEISSFLEQDKDLVQRKLDHASQNHESFIFFEETREKTGVLRFCCLNPLAIEWLTKYLATRKDNDPRLFPITQDGVQKMLYRLAKDSGLKTTGNLRFHKIRAWLMGRLSHAGLNEFEVKFIIGHAIALQNRAYLDSLEETIEEKYPLIYEKELNINPTNGNGKVSKLSEEVTRLQNEINELKFQSDYRFNELINALEEKLSINIDVSKLLAKHSAKYEHATEEEEETEEKTEQRPKLETEEWHS